MNTKHIQPMPQEIEKRAFKRLSFLFGGSVPELVKRELSRVLDRFPDVDYPQKDKYGNDITPDNVDLMAVEMITDKTDGEKGRPGSCMYSLGKLIDLLAAEFLLPAKPGLGPTPLQQKVWAMTEKQYMDFINDTSIPTADRLSVSEIWHQKPDEEAEYLKKITDESIPLEDRERLRREHHGEPDPKEQEAKQKARDERLQSPDVATEEKITTWLKPE